MDHREISNLRDWPAFLFAVDHQPIDAALVRAGCAEEFAVPVVRALECGIAAGIAIVSVSDRTAHAAGCTRLELDCGLRLVSSLFLLQRAKRSGPGGPGRPCGGAEKDVCAEFTHARRARSGSGMATSAVLDRA